jgi:hypothetical protein
MPKAWFARSRGYRSFPSQVYLLTSRFDVCAILLIFNLTYPDFDRPELFDEYTRRQYVAKAPERNPFGTDEEPAKFADFDVFTKVGIGSTPLFSGDILTIQ